MSQGTPRKFSEKIAILERKQNEEQEWVEFQHFYELYD